MVAKVWQDGFRRVFNILAGLWLCVAQWLISAGLTYRAAKESVIRKMEDVSSGGGDGDGEGGEGGQSQLASSAAEAVESYFRSLFLFFGPAVVFALDFLVLIRFAFT